MAKAKSRKRSSGAKKKTATGRPRNPFAIVLRKRAAIAEPSPRAYKRRTKHPTKIVVEE
jgi:hypothetical protein